MSDFDQRLKQALQRGAQKQQSEREKAAEKQASEDEMRRLHSKYRLAVSEHIEQVIKKLCDLLPGFRYETLYGEQGWGGAGWKDELQLKSGQSQRRYSRIEVTVRPLTSYFILELKAKGTIKNREVLARAHFEPVIDANPDTFRQLVDSWTLQFAELYAADVS